MNRSGWACRTTLRLGSGSTVRMKHCGRGELVEPASRVRPFRRVQGEQVMLTGRVGLLLQSRPAVLLQGIVAITSISIRKSGLASPAHRISVLTGRALSGMNLARASR